MCWISFLKENEGKWRIFWSIQEYLIFQKWKLENWIIIGHDEPTIQLGMYVCMDILLWWERCHVFTFCIYV